jgi:hypothetical protein
LTLALVCSTLSYLIQQLNAKHSVLADCGIAGRIATDSLTDSLIGYQQTDSRGDPGQEDEEQLAERPWEQAAEGAPQ